MKAIRHAAGCLVAALAVILLAGTGMSVSAQTTDDWKKTYASYLKTAAKTYADEEDVYAAAFDMNDDDVEEVILARKDADTYTVLDLAGVVKGKGKSLFGNQDTSADNFSMKNAARTVTAKLAGPGQTEDGTVSCFLLGDGRLVYDTVSEEDGEARRGVYTLEPGTDTFDFSFGYTYNANGTAGQKHYMFTKKNKRTVTKRIPEDEIEGYKSLYTSQSLDMSGLEWTALE